jgi:hypothetical protein
MFRNPFWAAAGAALVLAAAGCGGGQGGALAKVNDTTISMTDFHNYLETKANVRVVVQGQSVELPVADTLGFQAMQDLVAQKLLLQLARDEGVAPTPEDIEKEIKLRQVLQPGYVQALNQRSLTTGQIKSLVEIQLAQERLITKGVKVSKEEVNKVIKNRPNLFIEPEKASLEVLYVTTQDKRNKADQAIRSGTGFTTVRAQFDESPPRLKNQFDGSRLSGEGLPVQSLNEPFRSQVVKASAGSMTGWMKAGQGWARILVHQKKPSKKLEQTPERLSFLERQIALEKGAQGKDLTKRVADKLRASKIDILDSSFKGPWDRFETRLKEQAEKTKLPDNS